MRNEPSPAPWTAHGFAVYSGETLVAQVPVAEFSDDRYLLDRALPEAEAKLNLRLIRMAPELASALSASLEVLDSVSDPDSEQSDNAWNARKCAERIRVTLAALAAEEDSDV